MLEARELVGRGVELDALRGASSGGRRRVGGLAVVGPAGIGKSAPARSAAGADGRVLIGRASLSTRSGLSPIVEIALELVQRGARHDGVGLGVLRPAVAVLLPGLDVGDAGLQVQVPDPVLLAEGVLRLWSTLPVPRRPVLLLEDLHWAGEATWTVADRLLRRAAGYGAVVVVTSRREGPWWPELDHAIRTGEVTGIELGPLPPPAVAELVAGCLGIERDGVPVELLEVVEAAGGVPLMVEEVVADLVRDGALVLGDGGW